MSRRSTRREFLQKSTLAGVGFWVAGGVSLAIPKSVNEKLNIAIIGAGGQGGSEINGCSGENIVAMCDVDEKRAGKAFEQHPKAKKFKDYRKMLDEMGKQIDAVTVSTPDHHHAAASIMAMKMGKHVFCQKPLTHTVYEARLMRETAAKMKVATQMGNQGTSTSGLRRAVEVIRAGALGPVHEVHVWTNRPIWPQGIARPKDTPPVPDTLAWDIWLGPAPVRPYNEAYAPFKWRGWVDFGTGALGDMGCHTANLPFMALKLGHPQTVEAESGPLNGETYPIWAKVKHTFPARGEMPPVTLTWYEGRKDGKLVQPPDTVLKSYKQPKSGHAVWFDDSPDGRRVFYGLPKDQAKEEKDTKKAESGCFIVGEKGVLFTASDYGDGCVIIRDGEVEKVGDKLEKLPRSPGHHKEWLLACKGGTPAMSNFSYAGMLTEFILLGNVAILAGKKLDWDGPALKATNCSEADQFIRTEYRKGWSL